MGDLQSDGVVGTLLGIFVCLYCISVSVSTFRCTVCIGKGAAALYCGELGPFATSCFPVYHVAGTSGDFIPFENNTL